ncbi:MAG: hypothetical protein HRU19_22375 [Pseudobacteriovorax sp.]|nr:hypothetical protein [Pseudobacteriovorax sp.]
MEATALSKGHMEEPDRELWEHINTAVAGMLGTGSLGCGAGAREAAERFERPEREESEGNRIERSPGGGIPEW